MDTSDEDLAATFKAARRLAQRMDAVLEPDGFNILNSCRPAAWQTVFHFHIHVVPRYEDDPLKLPWVPGSGDEEQIKSVAEALRG
jgi:histidine triad (HIT) family protein